VEGQLVECGEVHACHVVNIEVGCHLAKWPELQFTEAPPNREETLISGHIPNDSVWYIHWPLTQKVLLCEPDTD